MKTEALLFDLGKVLVDFDFAVAMDRLTNRCDLPPEQFRRVVFDKAWLEPYERGEISTVEYHRYLCETGKLHISLDEFHAFWASVFMPGLLVPEKLIASLSRRYPLILVSNTNESHVDYIEKNYDFFQYFGVKIFSHVVGSLKPDSRIYQAAIDASGHPPQALFFTDDREENVRGAEAMGIPAHQFTSVNRLVEALHSHGVDVGTVLD